MPFTIYCHTLVRDGRRYIGQTRLTWQRRWKSHITAARKAGHGHFAGALRKYGPEAFAHEVLDVCATQGEADAAERRWIAHFDSTNRALGFNRRDGGQGDNNAALRESKGSPKARARASAQVTDLWSDPAYKASRSAAIAAGKAAEDKSSLYERIQTKRVATLAKRREERTHFDCKEHGPIPLAECYSKTSSQTGYTVYSCPACTLAAQKAKRDADRAANPIAPRTSVHCKKHGDVPFDQCFRIVRDGRVTHRCKVCHLAQQKKYRARTD